MRRNVKFPFFMGLLIAALFLTAGLYLDASNPSQAHASSVSDFEHTGRESKGNTVPQSDSAIPAKLEHTESLTKETSITYETTAYYLNVRSEATAKSKIMQVVKRGTKLEVVDKTGNGWLRLNGGGFVHGGYAKPVEAQTKRTKRPLPQEPVKALSLAVKPAAPTSVVMSDSGLSDQDVAQLLRGTSLAGHRLEKAIVEAENRHGINALFTVAVMKLESGNGKSSLSRNKNNLFGLNSSKGYLSFESKTECVQKFGQLISKNYIGKGYTTVEKVARKYCPANSKWPGLVKTIMNRDYRQL